jgi:adenylate kinase family enzyme
MKTILLLLGPNGIGKSTTAKHILEKHPNTALVDSDWCRAMNPYNIDAVTNNIYSIISNYFH